MFICCRHCKHTGSHHHERGWTCKKHDVFINLNDYESMNQMFNCKDCTLGVGDIFRIAPYCNTISFQIVFDEYFCVMNNMGVYIKDDEKWDNGRYKYKGISFVDVYDTHNVDNTHIMGYKLLFNDFPVFYTEDKKEIDFIKEGLGL